MLKVRRRREESTKPPGGKKECVRAMKDLTGAQNISDDRRSGLKRTEVKWGKEKEKASNEFHTMFCANPRLR